MEKRTFEETNKIGKRLTKVGKKELKYQSALLEGRCRRCEALNGMSVIGIKSSLLERIGGSLQLVFKEYRFYFSLVKKLKVKPDG